MNIRCAFCQMPYTLSRVEMLDALQEMDAHKLTHYDAHCPRCRRATQIPRQRMEMFMPNWREELKQFEVEMKEHPQQEAPLPSHEAVPVAEAAPAPETKAVKKEEPVTKSKPAARKPAPKTAPKEKGPAKKTPAASKGKKTTKKSK
jgi:phage FluMu protein Com